LNVGDTAKTSEWFALVNLSLQSGAFQGKEHKQKNAFFERESSTRFCWNKTAMAGVEENCQKQLRLFQNFPLCLRLVSLNILFQEN
jgi:hypothetical protein